MGSPGPQMTQDAAHERRGVDARYQAMRVTMVNSSLLGGGAERVMVTMANAWAARGWPVEIVTLADAPSFYPLDPAVTHTRLGLRGASGNPARAVAANARRLVRLRRAIRASRPDVVVAFMGAVSVQTLLATRGLGAPVVVGEHSDPTLERVHPAWRALRRATYPLAARVLVLSEVARDYFPPAIRRRTEVMPNPVAVAPPSADIRRGGRRQVVGMGRLVEEKGFDALVDAFARLAPAFPDWDLVVWGEGPARPALEARRDRLGLGGRVRLPGQTTAPHDRLREADLFALASRREGFPMALAEALACGLPAVAFDLPSGPKALIRDGVDGLLVPNGDTAALAAGLGSVMRDGALRSRMAARAPEVLDRYGVEAVMARWDELLDRVEKR